MANPTEFALPPPCAQTCEAIGLLLAIAPIPRQNNQDREVRIGLARNVDMNTVGRVSWQKSFSNIKIAMAAGKGKPKKTQSIRRRFTAVIEYLVVPQAGG